MARRQLNVRLPAATRADLERLMAERGMTATEVIILAIDRLVRPTGRRRPARTPKTTKTTT